MQKKVYMTVDGSRRETTSLVLKASDNTQKTASLEADVTLDLETKALGTVNLGQSYTVNPSAGKDGMNKVTFTVPGATSGSSPNYQTKNLGNVSAGQHYDVTADSGYDALSMVSFDVPSAQGGQNELFPQAVLVGTAGNDDVAMSDFFSEHTVDCSKDGLYVFEITGDTAPTHGSHTTVRIHIFFDVNNVDGIVRPDSCHYGYSFGTYNRLTSPNSIRNYEGASWNNIVPPGGVFMGRDAATKRFRVNSGIDSYIPANSSVYVRYYPIRWLDLARVGD